MRTAAEESGPQDYKFSSTDTEHPFIRARLVAQETKKTTKMDLTETPMTFGATAPVEGFRFLRFLLSWAMTGEKKKNPQLKSGFPFAGPLKSGDSNARWSVMPIRNLLCSAPQCTGRTRTVL